jgi:hypothetical protein
MMSLIILLKFYFRPGHAQQSSAASFNREPSVLRYRHGSLTSYMCGSRALSLSGNLQEEYGGLITLMKLHLDEEYEDIKELPQELNPLKAISDFLKYIHEIVVEDMRQKFETLDFSFDDFNKRIKYSLAIPAIWSSRSKAIMREAAVLAGMLDRNGDPGKLVFVREPVAAAIYVEQLMAKDGVIFKNNDTIIVCDAGGETTDLVALVKRTLQRSGTEITFFEEVTTACTAYAGYSSLFSKFTTYIKKIVQHYRLIKKDAVLEALVDEFKDYVKVNRDF